MDKTMFVPMGQPKYVIPKQTGLGAELGMSPDFPPRALTIPSCKLPQIIIKLCKE